MTSQKVFYLYRVKIFSTTYNNVLFAVNKVNKAVLVLLSHVAREKPAVFESFSRRLWISVVAGHNAGTFYAKLAHFATLYSVALIINYLDLPAKACLAYCAYLVNVIHAKVYTSRTYRFAKTIVSVIFVVRENLFPACNK